MLNQKTPQHRAYPLAFALTAIVLVQCPDVQAAAVTAPLLYVDNSTGDDISVVDVERHQVVATIPVGDRPHGVCASADGRWVYTTTESRYALKAIDTATNTVAKSWSLPADPNECAVTKNGRYVVVPLRSANNAVIFDTTTGSVVKTLPIKGPHNCFTPMRGSNDYVYCEETRAFDVAKIDMRTMDIVQSININGEGRPFIVTPDLQRIYTAISGLSGVAIVDIPAHTVTEVVLPATRQLTCTIEPGNTPTHGIALSPDLKKLWITDVAGDGLYVYDVATKKMSQKIPVGRCPNWLSFSADGKYLAVSNAESDSVTIIDAGGQSTLWEIPVGKGPKRLEFVDVPR